MKNIRVLYTFPNKEENRIVTVTLLENENDVKKRFGKSPALKPALECFKEGKQLIVNSAGGWCWLMSDTSNGCDIVSLD